MTCCVRSASSAELSVGSASASSIALVCSDWVPPATAAIAWIATRTTLVSGCWAVSVDPAVWVWKRSTHERGSRAPNSSRIIRAHIRRAARNFATSSRRLLWALKKNDRRGANSSIARPAATAARTYSRALARVNATSCTAVEPASRMWYPEIEIVFHFGTSRAQKANTSVIRRSEGRGGKR